VAEAPAPTTAVQICNLALARLGQKEPIESIETPSGTVEDLCALHYPVTRRRLLRGPRIYNFAKKYAQLALAVGVTPTFGFAKAYTLPNDFLRLLALGDITNADPLEGVEYDVVQNYIYTDEQSGENALNIYYIFDQTLVTRWDALFVNLMRLELASDLAYAFTLKPSLLRDLAAELKDVRLEAGAVAGQEKPPIRVERSRFVSGRRLGGVYRDTTRHLI
jgi:hypothetical protein